MSASTIPRVSVSRALGALFAFELATPLQAVFVGVEMDGPADPFLSILKIVGEGSVPIVDPDEKLPVAHLVGDGALARLEPDVGDLG